MNKVAALTRAYNDGRCDPHGPMSVVIPMIFQPPGFLTTMGPPSSKMQLSGVPPLWLTPPQMCVAGKKTLAL